MFTKNSKRFIESCQYKIQSNFRFRLQIIIYENNAMKATYNVLEEVKDLWFSPPYLFTARDLYITITEIKPGKYE